MYLKIWYSASLSSARDSDYGLVVNDNHNMFLWTSRGSLTGFGLKDVSVSIRFSPAHGNLQLGIRFSWWWSIWVVVDDYFFNQSTTKAGVSQGSLQLLSTVCKGISVEKRYSHTGKVWSHALTHAWFKSSARINDVFRSNIRIKELFHFQYFGRHGKMLRISPILNVYK